LTRAHCVVLLLVYLSHQALVTSSLCRVTWLPLPNVVSLLISHQALVTSSLCRVTCLPVPNVAWLVSLLISHQALAPRRVRGTVKKITLRKIITDAHAL
jgi:hypothetical protein